MRVDTTLLGFDQHSWVRGSRSYIFTGTESGVAKFTEIDHDTKQVYTEEMGVDSDLGSLFVMSPQQGSPGDGPGDSTPPTGEARGQWTDLTDNYQVS